MKTTHKFLKEWNATIEVLGPGAIRYANLKEEVSLDGMKSVLSERI